MKNKRCAIVSMNEYAVGGVTRVTLNLAQGLLGRGYDIALFFPASIDERHLASWASEAGVEPRVSHAVPLDSGERSWRQVWFLTRMLREYRPHVVSLHYGGNHLSLKDVVAARLAGAKSVFIHLHSEVGWQRAGRRKRLMTKIASTLATGIVHCCRPGASVLLEAGVREEKVAVIEGGVAAPTRIIERAAARAILGLPESAFVAVSIVRLDWIKGVDVLINAIADVRRAVPDTQIVVKGDNGPETMSLIAQAKATNLGAAWHLLGPDADNEAIYAAADVFVLPSRNEGYPLVLMEAGLRGLPCVATAVGGVGDLIIDGETGLLVPPDDARSLASAISLLATDPALRTRMSSLATRDARTRFSADRMSDRCEALYFK